MNDQPTEREIVIAIIGLSLCAWVVLVTLARVVWHMLEAAT